MFAQPVNVLKIIELCTETIYGFYEYKLTLNKTKQKLD